jgi:hypothetical protein
MGAMTAGLYTKCAIDSSEGRNHASRFELFVFVVDVLETLSYPGRAHRLAPPGKSDSLWLQGIETGRLSVTVLVILFVVVTVEWFSDDRAIQSDAPCVFGYPRSRKLLCGAVRSPGAEYGRLRVSRVCEGRPRG